MPFKQHTRSDHRFRTRPRLAVSMLEVVISLSLLTTSLSVSLPMIVRHGHLLIAQRHYRQALDELSNQLDRLTSLDTLKLDQALKQLSPSPFVAARLSNARLQGEVKSDDAGQRVTLHLTWDDPREERVTMTGWVFPYKDNSTRKSEP